jgi:hypothetical protein
LVVSARLWIAKDKSRFGQALCLTVRIDVGNNGLNQGTQHGLLPGTLSQGEHGAIVVFIGQTLQQISGCDRAPVADERVPSIDGIEAGVGGGKLRAFPIEEVREGAIRVSPPVCHTEDRARCN